MSWTMNIRKPVTTNNHWRETVSAYDVPQTELDGQFDYLKRDDLDCAEFFSYRGTWYCTDQFMRFGYPFGGGAVALLEGWQGYLSDSFYSGIVIRWSEDGEKFQVGTYIM